MRATTLLNRVLNLPGVRVAGVDPASLAGAGPVVVEVSLLRRRLARPEQGVVTEAVPFARAGARFTRDFDDLVVWLVARSDKTTVSTFARIAWRTVGAMCERVAGDVLDPHRASTVVWGAPGKDAKSPGTGRGLVLRPLPRRQGAP